MKENKVKINRGGGWEMYCDYVRFTLIETESFGMGTDENINVHSYKT